MQTVERLSTLALKPQKRLQFWNDIAAQAYAGTRIQSADPLFQAELWRWRLGDLNMIRPRSPNAAIDRHADIRVGDRNHVVLHLLHRGRAQVRQQGRIADLAAGDLEINFAQEFYHLDVSHENDCLSVEMPIQPLLNRGIDIEGAVCRPISGRRAAVQLLHSFILSLWRMGQNAPHSDDFRDDAVAAFYSLLAAALRDAGEDEEQRGLLDRLKRIVAAHLADPELGTAMLAAETGVTPRSVQSAFAERGATPSAYIANARLDQAAEWLRIYPERSITDIALSAGFNDSAYFARIFRNCFGAPPRVWRQN